LARIKPARQIPRTPSIAVMALDGTSERR